jgi:hypothetical protein
MALEFTDYWAGSGKAQTENGFYLVSPSTLSSAYQARFSDGENWVWDGGTFNDLVKAENACREHHGETSI